MLCNRSAPLKRSLPAAEQKESAVTLIVASSRRQAHRSLGSHMRSPYNSAFK